MQQQDNTTCDDQVDTKGKSPLHYAAKSGDLERCKFLCTNFQYNVNLQSKKGRTPLMLAIKHKHESVALYLLDNAKINIHVLTKRQYHALHFAAYAGLFATCKKLVEMGAQLNAESLDNIWSVFNAVQSGNMELVQYLIAQGGVLQCAKNNWTLAMVAASRGNLEMLKYLHRDWKASLEAIAPGKISPLYLACEAGALPIVQYLIEEGHVQLNYKVKNTFTAMHIACHNGNVELVKYLIDHDGQIENLEPAIDSYVSDGAMEKFLDSQVCHVFLNYGEAVTEKRASIYGGVSIRNQLRIAPSDGAEYRIGDDATAAWYLLQDQSQFQMEQHIFVRDMYRTLFYKKKKLFPCDIRVKCHNSK